MEEELSQPIADSINEKLKVPLRRSTRLSSKSPPTSPAKNMKRVQRNRKSTSVSEESTKEEKDENIKSESLTTVTRRITRSRMKTENVESTAQQTDANKLSETPKIAGRITRSRSTDNNDKLVGNQKNKKKSSKQMDELVVQIEKCTVENRVLSPIEEVDANKENENYEKCALEDTSSSATIKTSITRINHSDEDSEDIKADLLNILEAKEMEATSAEVELNNSNIVMEMPSEENRKHNSNESLDVEENITENVDKKGAEEENVNVNIDIKPTNDESVNETLDRETVKDNNVNKSLDVEGTDDKSANENFDTESGQDENVKEIVDIENAEEGNIKENPDTEGAADGSIMENLDTEGADHENDNENIFTEGAEDENDKEIPDAGNADDENVKEKPNIEGTEHEKVKEDYDKEVAADENLNAKDSSNISLIDEDQSAKDRNDENETLSLKKDNITVSSDVESKIDQLIENISSTTSDESDEERHSLFNSMAEEGEEDTPSEGSNDIIDVGEEINTTESELESDDSYDKDSFIDDDGNHELLSGNEFDISLEEQQKKTRIIEVGSSSDEGIVRIKKTQKKVKVKKKSRIIRVEDSSSESEDESNICNLDSASNTEPSDEKEVENVEASSSEIEVSNDADANASADSKKIVIIENIILRPSVERSRPLDDHKKSLINDNSSSTGHATSDSDDNSENPQINKINEELTVSQVCRKLDTNKKDQRRETPTNEIFHLNINENKEKSELKKKKRPQDLSAEKSNAFKKEDFRNSSPMECISVEQDSILKEREINEAFSMNQSTIKSKKRRWEPDLNVLDLRFENQETPAKRKKRNKRNRQKYKQNVSNQETISIKPSRSTEKIQEEWLLKTNRKTNASSLVIKPNLPSNSDWTSRSAQLLPYTPSQESVPIRCSKRGQAAPTKFDVKYFKSMMLCNNSLRRVQMKKMSKKKKC